MQLFDSAVLKPPAPGAHDWSVHETGEVGSGRLTATATGPRSCGGGEGTRNPFRASARGRCRRGVQSRPNPRGRSKGTDHIRAEIHGKGSA